jgi:hypothetical protein
VIASKTLLNMGRPIESKDNLDSIPLSLHTRPEVLELKNLTAIGAKECGNVKLKEGCVDEAITFYSCAIYCDSNNHLLYSNRSAGTLLDDSYRCIVPQSHY